MYKRWLRVDSQILKDVQVKLLMDDGNEPKYDQSLLGLCIEMVPYQTKRGGEASQRSSLMQFRHSCYG